MRLVKTGVKAVTVGYCLLNSYTWHGHDCAKYSRVHFMHHSLPLLMICFDGIYPENWIVVVGKDSCVYLVRETHYKEF